MGTGVALEEVPAAAHCGLGGRRVDKLDGGGSS